jgi:hypothetical protein
LQELIAPPEVDFFSCEGIYLGNKDSLATEIHDITGIPTHAFKRGVDLSQFTLEDRMRWAANRVTKKGEDWAYCQMGILDVAFVPNYGEGKDKAIHRLKDEVARRFRSQLHNTHPNLLPGDQPKASNQAAQHGPEEEAKKLESHRKSVLTSLVFDSMDLRLGNIKDGDPATCSWLLEHEYYQHWVGSPEQVDRSSLRGVFQTWWGSEPISTDEGEDLPFLWVNGKAGAGKSTLMKYAQKCAVRNKGRNETVLSFFFNARGDELGRSTLGMYRSLLHQLLTALPDLQTTIDPTSAFYTKFLLSPTWTIGNSTKLFAEAVEALGDRHLRCYIDALDESDDEDVQDMVEFFERLSTASSNSRSRFRVCFASRHYPSIVIRHGRKLIVEEEPGHKKDMAQYIRTHLRAGHGPYLDGIREKIQQKANGVFMWTVLVVNILNKEFRRGSIFAVHKRLGEVPPELSNLFRDMLKRDDERLDEFLLCLQWILFSKRPLTREEFYVALAVGLGYVDAITMGIPNDLDNFVFSASKGLAEVTRAGAEHTVQFIHESVRDFLMADDGLRKLWPNLNDDLRSSSHDRLKFCCQQYIEADLCTSERDSLGLPMFLDYSTLYMFKHADDAAINIPQDSFLQAVQLDKWVEKQNQRGDVIYTTEASLLYVLAATDCHRLIRSMRPHEPILGIDREVQTFRYPLFVAIANSCWQALAALLRLDDADSKGQNLLGQERLLSSVPREQRFFHKNDTPLLWALDTESHPHGEDRNAVLQAILGSGRVDVQERNSRGQTALCLVAEAGSTSYINQFLDLGADIEAKDHCGRTPLILAARAGRADAVNALCRRGAKLDVRDAFKESPLILAARRGWMEVVEMLLRNGAKIDITDGWGRSAVDLVRGEIETEALDIQRAGNQEDRKVHFEKILSALENHVPRLPVTNSLLVSAASPTSPRARPVRQEEIF